MMRATFTRGHSWAARADTQSQDASSDPFQAPHCSQLPAEGPERLRGWGRRNRNLWPPEERSEDRQVTPLKGPQGPVDSRPKSMPVALSAEQV